MRLAIFFTPPPDHPLTRAAALWLGRDAFSGEEFLLSAADGFSREEIRELTAPPRRYGFHATLQPPFRLADGHTPHDVEEALASLCAGLPAISLGTLRVERIGSFFALTPADPVRPVRNLADEVVRRFDPHRAPPTPDEIERRQPHRLSARQRRNLDRWGYPYVFEDFRFHMTLTGRVPEIRQEAVQRLLERRFRPVLDQTVMIDALTLFVEPSPPSDFIVRTRIPLCATQPMDAA